MSKKEYSSTYERLVKENPNFENELNKKYQDFILSELLLARMDAASARTDALIVMFYDLLKEVKNK